MKIITAVYLITNIVNKKKYVGSARDLYARWACHASLLNSGKHINKKLKNAWNKHGIANFEFSILEEVFSESSDEELATREQFWIDELEAFGPKGYNLLPYARTSKGYKHTEESLAKMSAFQKGKVVSKESRLKISKALKGKPISEEVRLKRVGRKRTAESIEKSRVGLTGQKRSKETKAKIAEASFKAMTPERIAYMVALNTGREVSEDTRLKLSLAGAGRPHTEEHKKKLSEAATLRWAKARAKKAEALG